MKRVLRAGAVLLASLMIFSCSSPEQLGNGLGKTGMNIFGNATVDTSEIVERLTIENLQVSGSDSIRMNISSSKSIDLSEYNINAADLESYDPEAERSSSALFPIFSPLTDSTKRWISMVLETENGLADLVRSLGEDATDLDRIALKNSVAILAGIAGEVINHLDAFIPSDYMSQASSLIDQVKREVDSLVDTSSFRKADILILQVTLSVMYSAVDIITDASGAINEELFAGESDEVLSRILSKAQVLVSDIGQLIELSVEVAETYADNLFASDIAELDAMLDELISQLEGGAA